MKSDDWDRRYAGTELVWSAGPNRLFAAEVAELAPGRALDLACGEGRTAVWLAERGWDVTAVDFSAVALEKARAIAERRGVAPRFVLADLVDYRPAAQAFDLVALLYLQLRAAELQTVLSRAAAAVAPGGTFLLIGHDLANLTEGSRRPPRRERPLHAPKTSSPPCQGSTSCGRNAYCATWKRPTGPRST